VSVEGRWRVILDAIACTDDLITITITIVVLAVAVVVTVDVVIAHSVTRLLGHPPRPTAALVARKITLGRPQVDTPGRKVKQSGRERLQE
jgi:hypothetical protein